MKSSSEISCNEMMVADDEILTTYVMEDFSNKYLWSELSGDPRLIKRVQNILYDAKSHAETTVRNCNLALARDPNDDQMSELRSKTLSFIGLVTGRQKFLKTKRQEPDYAGAIRRHKYTILSEADGDYADAADLLLWAILEEK